MPSQCRESLLQIASMIPKHMAKQSPTFDDFERLPVKRKDDSKRFKLLNEIGGRRNSPAELDRQTENFKLTESTHSVELDRQQCKQEVLEQLVFGFPLNELASIRTASEWTASQWTSFKLPHIRTGSHLDSGNGNDSQCEFHRESLSDWRSSRCSSPDSYCVRAVVRGSQTVSIHREFKLNSNWIRTELRHSRIEQTPIRFGLSWLLWIWIGG